MSARSRQWHIDPRLAHWHPVMPASDLRGKPESTTVCGVPIVLFPSAEGTIAALYDRCAHRRAPLSEGWVSGGSVVCPYHACRFAVDGSGYCPTTGSTRLRVPAFEARTEHGVIWVRSPSAAAERDITDADAGLRPELSGGEDHFAGVVHLRIEAPLQLVVDNMTELEHTGAVHSALAFGVDDYSEVETSCEKQGDGISIFYRGPQRPVPLYLGASAGIHEGDTYSQTADVSFTPPSASYRLWWNAPNGAERPFRIRFVIYYTPIDDTRTRLFAFIFWQAASRTRRAIMRAATPVLRATVRRELMQDKRIIEKLPQEEIRMDFFQLNHFDRPLVLTRKLMARLYSAEPKTDATPQHRQQKVTGA